MINVMLQSPRNLYSYSAITCKQVNLLVCLLIGGFNPIIFIVVFKYFYNLILIFLILFFPYFDYSFLLFIDTYIFCYPLLISFHFLNKFVNNRQYLCTSPSRICVHLLNKDFKPYLPTIEFQTQIIWSWVTVSFFMTKINILSNGN